jgi:hypothetical protein
MRRGERSHVDREINEAMRDSVEKILDYGISKCKKNQDLAIWALYIGFTTESEWSR